MDERTRALLAKSDQFESLRSDAAWSLLQEVVATEKQKHYDKLTTELMKGREIDQRELDYQRGLIAGMELVVNYPSKLQKQFESALKREGHGE